MKKRIRKSLVSIIMLFVLSLTSIDTTAITVYADTSVPSIKAAEYYTSVDFSQMNYFDFDNWEGNIIRYYYDFAVDTQTLTLYYGWSQNKDSGEYYYDGVMEMYNTRSELLELYNYLEANNYQVNTLVLAEGWTVLNAFDASFYCSSVILPDTLTAIEYMPTLDNITEFSIPKNVTSIPSGIQIFMPQVAAISVSEENTTFEDVDGVVYGKINHTLYAYPEAKTNSDYDVIDGTTDILAYAFNGSKNLKNITIPASVTSIGEGVNVDATFDSVSIECITVDEGNANYSSADGVLFNKAKTELLTYPKHKTAKSYAVPDTVTAINSISNSCLESIYFPDSVVSIASLNCDSIQSVIWPETLTACPYGMGNSSSNNQKLDAIAFLGTQSGGTQLGTGDFFSCAQNDAVIYSVEGNSIATYYQNSGYTIHTIETGKSGVCGDSIRWVYSDGTLWLSGVGDTYDYSTFADAPWAGFADEITTVSIYSGISHVGDNLFYGLTNLATIKLPDASTTISDTSFPVDLSGVSLQISSKSTVKTTLTDRGAIASDYLPESINSAKAAIQLGEDSQFTEESVSKLKAARGEYVYMRQMCTQNNFSDYQKVLWVYTYICQNFNYDYATYNDKTTYKSMNYMDSLLYVLDNNEAICDGYANVFKFIMDEVGIECYSVKATSMDHAWNIVKINDAYYHVDATWGANQYRQAGGNMYRYFLLTDAQIGTDHYGWTKSDYPKVSTSNASKPGLDHNATCVSYERSTDKWYVCAEDTIYEYNFSSGAYTAIYNKSGAQHIQYNPLTNYVYYMVTSSSNDGYLDLWCEEVGSTNSRCIVAVSASPENGDIQSIAVLDHLLYVEVNTAATDDCNMRFIYDAQNGYGNQDYDAMMDDVANESYERAPAYNMYVSSGSFLCGNTIEDISVVTIEDDSPVTTIGAFSFYGWSNLKDIYIPDTVTYISDYAFISQYDAFGEMAYLNDLIIHGPEGSYAQTWAAGKRGVTFVVDDDAAYTVTFLGNGGSWGAQSSVTKKVYTSNKDSVYFPSEPSKADSTLIGYNTKADGSGTSFQGISSNSLAAILDSGIMQNSSTARLTLYAQWESNSDNNSGDSGGSSSGNGGYTGLATDESGVWRLYENGKVNYLYSDLYYDPVYGWWKVLNGTIDFGYTGLYNSPSCGWWKINGGTIDFNYNDLYFDQNVGWWKINGGTVDFGYTDLYYSPSCGWWKINGGTVDFGYTELYCSPTFGWWKINGGAVDFGYTELYCSPYFGWWKINGGAVDFGYTELYCSPTFGWWKINGGAVDFGYTDLYCSPTFGWWKINGGAVDFGYTDLYCSPTFGWWKINGGAVDFGYTGLYYSPMYGDWYINGGAVVF